MVDSVGWYMYVCVCVAPKILGISYVATTIPDQKN